MLRENEILLSSLGLASFGLPSSKPKPQTIIKKSYPVSSSSTSTNPTNATRQTRSSLKRKAEEQGRGREGERKSARIKAIQEVESAGNGESKSNGKKDESRDEPSGNESWRSRPAVRGVILPAFHRQHPISKSSSKTNNKNATDDNDDDAEEEPDETEQDLLDYYSKTQSKPTRMTDGTNRYVFDERWKGIFEPNVGPEEMFLGGAFGGNFFA